MLMCYSYDLICERVFCQHVESLLTDIIKKNEKQYNSILVHPIASILTQDCK